MNILIIEDSSSVSHIISSILRSREYIVKETTSMQFEERDIKSGVFELIILNTSLDKGTFEIQKRIRNESNRILLLGVSTKSTWKEKVDFLYNGGDDVLDYPFPMQELLARISSLQRRPKENNEGLLKFKDLEINSEAKNVTKSKKEIPLRRREFTLLEYMVRNKNRTVSRAELLDHVWDYRRATGSNTVDVHVKRLRDKLMDRELIETVHGFGYTVKDKKVETKTQLQDL